MTQRTWAALLAVPLFVALGLYVAITGLPFVTYAPGPTVNVLGENDGKPIIEVQRAPDLPATTAQLRMTTVSVTERNAQARPLHADAHVDRRATTRSTPSSSQYGTTGSQQQDTAGGPGRDGHLPGLRDRGRADRSSATRSTRRSRSSSVTDGHAGRRQARGARRAAQGQWHAR